MLIESTVTSRLNDTLRRHTGYTLSFKICLAADFVFRLSIAIVDTCFKLVRVVLQKSNGPSNLTDMGARHQSAVNSTIVTRHNDMRIFRHVLTITYSSILTSSWKLQQQSMCCQLGFGGPHYFCE